MGKAITEELKKQISEFYGISGMSNFEIAKALDVSPRSVRRYKHYLNQDPSESMFVEKTMPSSQDPVPQTSQTIEEPEEAYQSDRQEEETTEEPSGSDDEMIEYVEVTKCPNCDTPKSEWMTIDQAKEAGYKINEGQQRFYSYVCTNPDCHQLIPEKRCYIEGTCPGCGSTSIDWMPIEDTYVSDEDKRNYDFLCVDCLELIKVID